MKASHVAFCAVLLLIFLAEANVSEAITCTLSVLDPCIGAIRGSGPPSSVCCNKVRAQRPCFCHYLKDTEFRQIVNSPSGKKVAAACGVSIPKC